MKSAAAAAPPPTSTPQASIFFFFLLIAVALHCGALAETVDAARQLRPPPASAISANAGDAGDAGGGRPVQQSQQGAAAYAYATLHERARSSSTAVMAWRAQLPAGPSPRGPGH